MALPLVFTSKSGNTKTFVDYLKKKVNVNILDFDYDVSEGDSVILGAYTWSAGKIPIEMKQFLIRNKDRFEGKKVFIFGSGNSVYPRFCAAVDGIAKIVTDCGAEVVGILKFEQRFIEEENKAEVEKFLQKMINQQY
jgi:flavodoxin I